MLLNFTPILETCPATRDRLPDVLARLKKAGIALPIIHEMPVVNYIDVCNEHSDIKRKPTWSTKGKQFSRFWHLWKILEDYPNDMLLIIEDDAIPDNQLVQKTQHLIYNTHHRWDCYQLGWSVSDGEILPLSPLYCRAADLSGSQCDLWKPGEYRRVVYDLCAGNRPDIEWKGMVGDKALSRASFNDPNFSRLVSTVSLCGQGGNISAVTGRKVPVYGHPGKRLKV
jgi:hypothetical protein